VSECVCVYKIDTLGVLLDLMREYRCVCVCVCVCVCLLNLAHAGLFLSHKVRALGLVDRVVLCIR
jgi:hypothetical protein